MRRGILCLSFLLFWIRSGASEPLDSAFTRFQYFDYDQGILWTATVTLRKGETEVDLVSAVHIADREYYQEIQRELSSCDKVFFELVANEKAKQATSLSKLLIEVSQALGLSHQVAEIDYNQPNFIHADLSWQEIAELLKGGNLPPPPEEPLIRKVIPNLPRELHFQEDPFLYDPKSRAAFKVALGRILGDIEGAFALMNANLNKESVLITKRNARALQVAKPYLKGKTRVAIFYGAAHMPDFAKRLRKMGFKPVFVRWHMAWRIGRVPHVRWF